MIATVRVVLLLVGLLAYAAVGVGLAQHAADEDHVKPKPTSPVDKQPGAKRNRVDQGADPAFEYLNEGVVGSRVRVVVSPDHVTRPTQ